MTTDSAGIRREDECFVSPYVIYSTRNSWDCALVRQVLLTRSDDLAKPFQQSSLESPVGISALFEQYPDMCQPHEHSGHISGDIAARRVWEHISQCVTSMSATAPKVPPACCDK